RKPRSTRPPRPSSSTVESVSPGTTKHTRISSAREPRQRCSATHDDIVSGSHARSSTREDTGGSRQMSEVAFWAYAQKNPSYVAVVDVDGREITAGELSASANQLVHGLRALGLKRGDAIAAMVVNEAAMIELYLAATQAGFYITPINSHLAPPEVAYI